MAVLSPRSSVDKYLNEAGRRGDLPVEVFLSLLLLHLQGEAGAQDSL